MPAIGYNRIMKFMPKYLEINEKILSVGDFVKFSYGDILLTRGILYYFNKEFMVGITNRGVLILPINSWGKVVEAKVRRFSFESVEIKNDKLNISIPNEEKPLVLKFNFGFYSLSGLDDTEFIEVLYKHKST